MPTRNRRRFVGQAIWYFLRQDYPHKELIIVDDGEDAIMDLVPKDDRIRYLRLNERTSLGTKRNIACEMSQGDLIAHWDDDDWMASNRLSIQIGELFASEADICGGSDLFYYNLEAGEAWRYKHLNNDQPFLIESTLIYRRSLWIEHPFPDFNNGIIFIKQFAHKQMHNIKDTSFYISLIHSENTNPINLANSRWQKCPVNIFSQLMGKDREFYVDLRQNQYSNVKSEQYKYLISCIMPTYNRSKFVEQAIKLFMRQDYQNKELIIVDDSSQPIDNLIPKESSIHYIRIQEKLTIGKKRNIACNAANGEIILLWDDDDWYSPNRISYQAAPIMNGSADITALENCLFYSLPSRQFWKGSKELNVRMFYKGVVSGTIMFWKEYWCEGIHFPDTSLAEDAKFLEKLILRSARLKKLPNKDKFIYFRHESNSWRFTTGTFIDQNNWQKVNAPSFVPIEDLRLL